MYYAQLNFKLIIITHYQNIHIYVYTLNNWYYIYFFFFF